MKLHDVVIVGGGLVGGLTALLLSREGIDVTVLDAMPVLDEQCVLAQTNPRVLALNKATIQLLKIAGVWELLARYMPYTGMHVWNKEGYGDIEFGQPTQNALNDTEWLGVMVEPSILNLAIQQKMQACVADYRPQTKIHQIKQSTEGWRIELESTKTIQTKLLIGADGANSFVREQASIHLDVLDYHQSAIGCGIRTQQPHAHVARQIFLPTGPLAYLPMVSLNTQQDGYWQSIVWTLPQAKAEEYLQFNDAEFQQKLTQESLHMLGEVLEVTPRASFALKARATKHYVQRGLALVGDAAHVIHPLAGQGVNIGCLDAAILCDVLLKDLNRGTWATEKTLRRYEHLRKRQNEAMMHSMSFIGWLERSQFSPIIWARSFGLSYVQKSKMLKHLFMQHADGLKQLKNTRYASICIKN